MILYFLIITISQANIIFKHEPTIIELGKELNIECIFNKETEKFSKQFYYNDNLILYNTYNNKFKILNIKNSLILNIKNVTENDLNSRYTCKDNKNIHHTTFWIRTTTKTFINLPNNDNYIIHANLNNKTSIIINFKKIYPKPICFLKLDNKIKYFSLKKFERLNRYNYKIKLGLFGINITKYCKDDFIISCSLINKHFELNKDNIGSECPFNFILLTIPFSILFLIIIILLIITIIMLYKKRVKKNIEYLIY